MDPWVFPNGAHLRCRFPGIDFSIARGGFVTLPLYPCPAPPLIDRPAPPPLSPPAAPRSERPASRSKAELRAEALARRDALSGDERARAAAALADQADALHLAPGTRVASYVAIRSELDPSALVDRLAARGVRFCLPVVEADRETMHFRAWQPGETLVASSFGLSVPGEGAEIVEPDVLLMPLAAFDARGHRIGWGKGHYDRALDRLERDRHLLKIGLAFSVQQVDAVPFEPHDRPLDLILTEAGPLRPAAENVETLAGPLRPAAETNDDAGTPREE